MLLYLKVDSVDKNSIIIRWCNSFRSGDSGPIGANMSYIDVLPQELLFNVSEYGQVTPGLTPEYILNEVKSLDPNFDWSKEFTLEYLRATDHTYKRFGRILRSMDPTRDDCIDTRLSDRRWRQGSWDLRILRSCIDTDTVDWIESSYPGVDNDGYYVHIPIDDDMANDRTRIRIDRGMYLAHPRTSLRVHYYPLYSSKRGLNTQDLTIVRHKYPWLLNTMEKRGLPGAFPRWFGEIPTDLEIITAILQLNPEYDLGDLLRWLGDRSEVCNLVKNTEMYRLVSEHHIDYIEVDDLGGALSDSDSDSDSDSIDMGDPQIVKRLIMHGTDPLYLKRMGVKNIDGDDPRLFGQTDRGIPSVSVLFDSSQKQMYALIQSIIRDYMASRMCLMNYSPEMFLEVSDIQVVAVTSKI